MKIHHTLGLLLYFNPSNGKYFGQRFKRTKPFTADPVFETAVEITQGFSFSMEMTGPADEGDLSLEASGWGDLYDPPQNIDLGEETAPGNLAPSLANWPAKTAKPARKVDFTFTPQPGGAAEVGWSIAGGTSGKRPFHGGAPGKAYGVLLTLRFEQGRKARLKLATPSPWGTVDHNHP